MVKCSKFHIEINVVECALLVCVLCQPVPPSIHPSLHLIDSFRNLCKFLVSAPFLLLATAHALDASVIRARAPSNGAHDRKGVVVKTGMTETKKYK